MAQAAQPQPQRDPEWWRARAAREAMYPDVGIAAGQPRDQIRWGPVWAGAIVTIATLVILSLLGVAVGATALEPGADAQTMETGGFIWGGIAALIAFFLGGMTAGGTAAVRGPMAGTFNGAMVWALTLVISMLLLTLGAGAAVGLLGAFGMTGEDASGLFGGLSESGLWWTFGAMIVGLVIAALGGLVGSPKHNPEAGRGVETEHGLEVER